MEKTDWSKVEVSNITCGDIKKLNSVLFTTDECEQSHYKMIFYNSGIEYKIETGEIIS